MSETGTRHQKRIFIVLLKVEFIRLCILSSRLGSTSLTDWTAPSEATKFGDVGIVPNERAVSTVISNGPRIEIGCTTYLIWPWYLLYDVFVKNFLHHSEYFGRLLQMDSALGLSDLFCRVFWVNQSTARRTLKQHFHPWWTTGLIWSKFYS